MSGRFFTDKKKLILLNWALRFLIGSPPDLDYYLKDKNETHLLQFVSISNDKLFSSSSNSNYYFF